MANFAGSQFFRRFGWLTLGVSTLLLASCSEPPAPPKSQPVQAAAVVPEELLAKLRNTYTSAKSYSDNAILVERGVSRTRGTITEIPYTSLSLLFERPNRYAISYDYGIASNQGRTVYRVVSDGVLVRSMANELPEQIHEAFAASETTTDNIIPEPMLRQAILEVALENLFPQLGMLLARDAERQIFPLASRMEMLPEKSIGKIPCYRLALSEPAGTRVLWIDKDKTILRRMELPIDQLRNQMGSTKQYTAFSVDLDFENIAFDVEFDDTAFTLAVPEKARLVRRFVPPPPAGPAENLGQPVKDFAFTDVAGTKVTPATLAGKICVLDFWKTDCPPCKENTPELEAVYQQFKDAEDMVFYGVSTDPQGLPTESVAKALQSWGATFPLLRDLDNNGYYQLDVKATPTLMLLGPDGDLQDVHVGMIESADKLEKKIRQLQAGEDLVQQAKDQHAKQLEQHEAVVNAATLEKSLVDIKGTVAEIVPRKLPELFEVEELWKSKLANLTSPGDMQVLTAAISIQRNPLLPYRGGLGGKLQEVLVMDGGEAVVRFDGQGKLLGRVELPKHQERVCGFIRRAVDAEGAHWFLVSGVGWQQVYIYDKDWKLAFAFPDVPHSGVGDARFVDFKHNGVPTVVVGYWGGLGVQAGNLEGQRVWVNRHLDHVLQVAGHHLPKSSERTLWCTSTRGTVFEIAPDGKSQQEFAVVGHTMVALEAPTHEEATHYGISSVRPGQYALVAFNIKGDVAWSYELPPGEYSTPIPPIQRINLPDRDDCRMVAGPDGSLHFVGDDGKLIDRFDYGAAISGLATVRSGDGTILLVSAGNRLTAWRLTSPQKEAEPAP